MTALPRLDHLLTLEEWDELPEDEYHGAELVDGVVVATPSPTPAHQDAVDELKPQLKAAFVSHGLAVVREIDVVLVAGFPPLVRQPDLVVVSRAIRQGNPKRFMATDVVLAVEIVSPGSRHIDRMHKLGEYAEARIPNYWIVDIEGDPCLQAYSLAGDSYDLVGDFTGTAQLTDPAPATIDLAALLG